MKKRFFIILSAALTGLTGELFTQRNSVGALPIQYTTSLAGSAGKSGRVIFNGSIAGDNNYGTSDTPALTDDNHLPEPEQVQPGLFFLNKG